MLIMNSEVKMSVSSMISDEEMEINNDKATIFDKKFEKLQLFRR